MKCHKFVASLAIMLAFQCVSFGTILHEDFNDGAAAGRWSVAFQLEATRETTTVEDGSVDFAFDYSTLGIANPNGGADTIGAFIQVNSTDQVGDEGETYIIYPNGLNLSGDFVLEADMYVYNDGLAGTTELGMAGLFLDNSDPIAPYQWGSEGGPLAWIYSGEGGSTADLATFEEGTSSTTGYLPLADYGDQAAVPAGSIPGFQTGDDGGLGPAGSNASGSWVDVRIESAGSTINWYLNGALINSYDNSGGFYTTGNVFLGLTDPFNSANAGGGAIIDNVVVVPEPAAALLGVIGMMTFVGIRRRQ